MNESEKIDCAEYFLEQMIAHERDRRGFRCNLSAFLSTARSVLQYACREATRKPGGQTWYDTCMKNNPVFQFFRGERDLDIHEQPIEPAADYHVGINDTIGVNDRLEASAYKDGKVIDEKTVSDSTRKQGADEAVTAHTSFSVTYRFKDWKGDEDVLSLSTQYLLAVKAMVNDGISKKLISG